MLFFLYIFSCFSFCKTVPFRHLPVHPFLNMGTHCWIPQKKDGEIGAARCGRSLYFLKNCNMSASTSELFTTTTVISLLGVVAILVAAYTASALLLPKSARAVDRNIFIWLCFDALIHFIFEGSFLWHSTFGRAVFRASGPFAELCKIWSNPQGRNKTEQLTSVCCWDFDVTLYLTPTREGIC